MKFRLSILFGLCSLLILPSFVLAQDGRMTPELLWSLGRVSPVGLTKGSQHLIYRVSVPDVQKGTSESSYYRVSVTGGEPEPLENIEGLVADSKVSGDGMLKVSHKSVKLSKVLGSDYYPNLPNSKVRIYDALHYRHWDSWMNGDFNHVFLHRKTDEGWDEGIDIMEGLAFHTPTMPFGGPEDYILAADGSAIYYVTKAKSGTDYVQSTNTDIYRYDISTGETTNLTESNKGYDTHPVLSPSGEELAWLSMRRDGYESDKNDLIVKKGEHVINLTSAWDGTVNGFIWANDGKKLYFTAPVSGTIQVFEVDYPGHTKKMPVVKQLTEGMFNVSGIVADLGDALIVTRMDMNTATEIYRVDLDDEPKFTQLSHANDAHYAKIQTSKIEKRMVETTDGKQMLVWVIYPPNFDPNKKYPTLLYAQGGPQSALSQFYSFRWNFQLMAAHDYIIVAPNRRGMPGHGVEWNEQISGDWGGQAMQDYLSAIDELAKEPFVDETRLGAIGASFGGYSVFYLAGIHENRFKSFIAHAGVFNLRSMYGTTEELFFVNWDMGGPYWDANNEVAQKTYAEFNPINLVDQWDTPMMIMHGGKDFRVPESQGFEAFQVLQLKGIKSRLVYFPEENHWILNGQNALIWQYEFFKWLKETL